MHDTVNPEEIWISDTPCCICEKHDFRVTKENHLGIEAQCLGCSELMWQNPTSWWAHMSKRVYLEPADETPEVRLCNCETFTVVNFGCQCGGI